MVKVQYNKIGTKDFDRIYVKCLKIVISVKCETHVLNHMGKKLYFMNKLQNESLPL